MSHTYERGLYVMTEGKWKHVAIYSTFDFYYLPILAGITGLIRLGMFPTIRKFALPTEMHMI